MDEELWGNFSEEEIVRCFDQVISEDIEEIPRNAPLYTIRFGRLFVTHLSKQLWCEQQMIYNHISPLIVPEPKAVTVGKSIHLARELEIQDKVSVTVTSKEDQFAIKVVNIIICLSSFLKQGVSVFREVPMFGFPFNSGVFVTGVIDEICFDQENYQLNINELKTRSSDRMPGKSQMKCDRLQIMMYKKMFNDLIHVKPEDLSKHLKLDLNKTLGQDIQNQIPLEKEKLWTLKSLLLEMFSLLEAMPKVGQLLLEYAEQATHKTIHLEDVEYDEKWLGGQIRDSFEYWTGKRKSRGVEIHDIWKCNICPYIDVCEWRNKKRMEVEGKSGKVVTATSTSKIEL